MLQEIAPRHLNNHYEPRAIGPGARVCCFRDREVLIDRRADGLHLPKWEQLRAGILRSVYLFSVDDAPYFLAQLRPDFAPPEGLCYEELRPHRYLGPRHTVYAEMTAWYRDNQFCGRCGHPTVHDDRERMMRCPSCGNMIFPKICPAIIVGVTDGERILLTRYSGRVTKHYALVAGFTEIGETAEETVAREVYEETGLRVKNIRYYNTQPWGIDSDLLLGYFADLDGAPEITIDKNELSMAGWYHRDEIEPPADSASLTSDMIRAFVENRHPR